MNAVPLADLGIFAEIVGQTAHLAVELVEEFRTMGGRGEDQDPRLPQMTRP